jgi:hypothetical protein
MNQTDPFRNLNFSVRQRQLPARLIAVIVALVIFTILWRAIPGDALYWLLTLILAVGVWLASYGWRQAITHLIRFLQTLEQL